MRRANKRAESQNENKVIVIGETDWHIGVLGIVAMKVGESFQKSVLVWARDTDGNIKGSARSIGDIHLAQFFSEFPEGTFSAHGGHVKAGGFTVTPDAIYNLETVAQAVYENHKPIIDIEQETELIIDTNLSSITNELFSSMKKMSPFGLANPKPIFRIAGVLVTNVKIFGKNKEHVELTINDNGKTMQVISFFAAHEAWVGNALNNTLTILGTLDESNFGGRTTRRLRLVRIEN
jgi:single-stranded-DNA-specific exonuclease